MKKAFLLLLLFGGLVCLSFAQSLKADPGGGYAVPTALTLADVSQATVPAIAAGTSQTTVSILAAGFLSALAVALFVTVRRKPKSPLLRMRGSFLANLSKLVDTYGNRLFAYRTKSPWLKTQGSSDRVMMTA